MKTIQIPRVGIVSLFHESNTFAVGRTQLKHFEEMKILRGQKIIDVHRGSKTVIAGAITAMEEEGLEIVPLLHAYAVPGPMIARGVLDTLWRMVEEELAQVGHLDAVFVYPHGAAVSEDYPEMDGEWLRRLRQKVGKIPLIGALDSHAIVAPSLLAEPEALLPFKTNPHVDAYERGYKATRILADRLRGKVEPVQRAAFSPMQINIEQQNTEGGPLEVLCRECERAEEIPGVLDASILLGFPYADSQWVRSGVQVVTDGDEELARETALRLAKTMWDRRETLLPSLISPEEALERLRAMPKPVCLLDMGDNVGGGGTAEGTWLLTLLEKEDYSSFHVIYNEQVAQQAIQLGEGSRIECVLGGRHDQAMEGPPFPFSGTVLRIPGEVYEETKVRHGGQKIFRIGPSALLKHDNGKMLILVTGLRTSLRGMGMFHHCGIRLHDLDIVVAKGVNGPLVAFDGELSSFIKVNTPGATCADLTKFDYQHRRVPLYPLERDFPVDWSKAVMGRN
jgi:microcystin degradation protein MlrC